MSINEILQAQFMEVVENQLRMDDPAETRLTLERLEQAGYSLQDSKKLISACVATAIAETLRNDEPFDEAKYIENLNRLPDLPE
ncbi:MAG TPA: DUF1841 family protein [Flavilitoribacter sp.]|nr:DUF1841 family protein [Flavilitoribacter sp.]